LRGRRLNQYHPVSPRKKLAAGSRGSLYGTGLEAPWAIHSRLVASGEVVKELCSRRIKSTNGLLLAL
jgi:hypothetical protein